jgi:hypothetical protein
MHYAMSPWSLSFACFVKAKNLYLRLQKVTATKKLFVVDMKNSFLSLVLRLINGNIIYFKCLARVLENV